MAHPSDVAELGVKAEANGSAINALGVQTAARFDRLEGRFDRLEKKVDDGFAETRTRLAEMDRGFAEIRGRLDGTAAWQERIVTLLDRLIADRGDR